MKKLCLKIAMVLLIAFLTLSAFGAREEKGWHPYEIPPSKMHKPGGSGYNVRVILRLKEKLELTDEQVNKLQAIRNETQGQRKANAEAVKATKEALQKAIESAATEAQLRSAAADVGKALGDQAVFAVANRQKIDAVLTDDQKAKLKSLEATRALTREKIAEALKGSKPTGKVKRPPRVPRGSKGGPRDPQAAFKRMDTNGDGSVSLEEFNAYGEKMKERRPRGRSRRGEPKPEN